MNLFFLFLELSIYIFIMYLFTKKEELSIVYLPVLFFADTIITNHEMPAPLFYIAIFILILKLIKENTTFYNNNIFSVLIILYFLLLITRSGDTTMLKENLFNVMLFFITLPLIPSIYEKYPRETIFKELAQSALIILLIFISNVILSTLLNYNLHFMYGISSGVLYGNLYATDFNILAIATFLVLYYSLMNKSLVYFMVFLISFCFIGLSLRRTVMLMSFLGVLCSMLLLMFGKKAKRVLMFGSILVVLGGVIVAQTNLIKTFKERYELRKLSERNLEEEKRLFEYELLYKDMFYYNRYSPWLGYELFNSPGNYGGGIFYERSLHGDLPSLAHSSGIIGVLLYILMMLVAFNHSFKAAETKSDFLILLFCFTVFVTYTISGRYSEWGSMLFIFLTAQLSLAKEENNVSEFKYLPRDSGDTEENPGLLLNNR